MSKEKWKVKIRLNNGTEILFPHSFKDIVVAGKYADYEAEKYQKLLGQKITEKSVMAGVK